MPEGWIPENTRCIVEPFAPGQARVIPRGGPRVKPPRQDTASGPRVRRPPRGAGCAGRAKAAGEAAGQERPAARSARSASASSRAAMRFSPSWYFLISVLPFMPQSMVKRGSVAWIGMDVKEIIPDS